MTNSQIAPSTTLEIAPGKPLIWTGRILWALAVSFFIFDAAIHIANIAPVVEASKQLGFDPNIMPAIGLVQLACLILYLVPRTAPLGAVLLTGYLGGAVITNIRTGMPFWFAVMMGAFLWISLYSRDNRVRNLLLPRSK